MPVPFKSTVVLPENVALSPTLTVLVISKVPFAVIRLAFIHPVPLVYALNTQLLVPCPLIYEILLLQLQFTDTPEGRLLM